MNEIKNLARAEAFARRAEAFAAGQGQAAEILADYLAGQAGRVLSGYMPMRTEIDPLPAMAAHRGPVGVPVIVGKGQALRFREWTPGSRMVEGAFKALIPAEGAWVEPSVLIVPLLAFDARGYRLGYGGGFYDRTLEGLRAKGPVLAVGFAFAAQEVVEVPIDATDQRLDAIATEQGVTVFCVTPQNS
jgi:5-formyltetrahydrofolate cyclo-ligase